MEQRNISLTSISRLSGNQTVKNNVKSSAEGALGRSIMGQNIISGGCLSARNRDA